MLDQQQSAAAAAEAAAAARGYAERDATAALERVAAVAAVFKMANLDEGLEGDCTCLQCMQSLADPVLLQVMAAQHQVPPRDF
jgi:propanediol dehydratase large subunit